jgi:excisionase family DNA binding protein
MRTFTLAEAARLLGTSRSVLYRKIDEGVLTYTSGGGPGKTSTVTEEALRLAGFDVPPEVEHLERLSDAFRTSLGSSQGTSQDAHRLQTLEQRMGHLERLTPACDDGKVSGRWIVASTPAATEFAHSPTLPDAPADRGPAPTAPRGHVPRTGAAGTADGEGSWRHDGGHGQGRALDSSRGRTVQGGIGLLRHRSRGRDGGGGCLRDAVGAAAGGGV